MDAVPSSIPKTFNGEVFDQLDDLDQRLYFRWDLTSDKVLLHAPVPRKFRELPQEVPQASTMFWTQNLIHPEDRPILHAYLHTLFHLGRTTCTPLRKASCKLRIRHHKNNYLWAEVHLITYFQDGRPIVAFGNLRSIQAQKLWQQRMQRRADADSLTGLLTKDAAIREIESDLATRTPERDSAVLLLIDADGFKSINDNFGHLFGDGVLSEMGSTIKRHFRQSDIKGRIGGDEFVVLLRGASDLDGIRAHCSALVMALHREYEAEGQRLPFSISMGIALYPEHGVTYRDLFKHADRALYEAKSRGKDQFRIYENKFYQTPQIKSQRDPTSSIDLQMKSFKDNMAEFILQIFYETNSAEATISYALGLFGRLYNLDRTAIAHYNQETGAYRDAYEWVGPAGKPLTVTDPPAICHRRSLILHQARPTPYGVMSICEDTSKLQPACAEEAQNCHIGAYAYSLITHGAETIGCIGVESLRPRRIKPELIRGLNVFSVLLGNILMPSDASKNLGRELRMLEDLLDHLPGFVYVVDKETMHPVFLGRSLRPILRSELAGACCYEQLHGRSDPCPDCPLPSLSRDGQEYRLSDLELPSGERIRIRVANLAEPGLDGHRLALIAQDTGVNCLGAP